MKSIEAIRTIVNSRNYRSAWDKGVRIYANELLDELAETIACAPEALDNSRLLKRALLNGAADWQQYSEGGCSLIYDREIAQRLCTVAELKRTQNGCKAPNSRERWLDVQARALYQACKLIVNAFVRAEA